MNPKLKKLEFLSLCPSIIDTIIDLTEYLQNIEHFYVNIISHDQDLQYNINPINLKSVKHLIVKSGMDSIAFFYDFMQFINKFELIFVPTTLEHLLRISSWLTDSLPLLKELEFTLYHFLQVNVTTDVVRQNVIDILSTFKAIPRISFNFCFSYGKMCNYCKIDKNTWIHLSDVWSITWTDYEHKRLTFERLE